MAIIDTIILGASVLAVGVGWFVVYKLDKRKALHQRELEEKTRRYHTIFVALQRLLANISTFEKAQEQRAKKLAKSDRMAQNAALVFALPTRESIENLIVELEDVDISNTDEVMGKVVIETLLGAQTDASVVRDELAFFQLMEYDASVKAQIEKAMGQVGLRLLAISAESLLAETSMKGTYKRPDHSQWLRDSANEIQRALAVMQEDLRRAK